MEEQTSTAAKAIDEQEFVNKIAYYYQNRKLRREFKKRNGIALPNVNKPFRKDSIVL